jgi:hypothetical protein
MADPKLINLSRKDKENVYHALQLLANQSSLRRQRKIDTINRLQKEAEELEKEAKGFRELSDKFFVMPLPEGIAEIERRGPNDPV